jgi:enediyne polyketide synthase
MTQPIAIVGMACEYPDAPTPEALWENVLAQRRAFRRLPEKRLRVEDYASPDPSTADATYATEAAVIEGFAFDRVAFCVAARTFASADLAHWLALDVAARALDAAGFREGDGLPRAATGVFLGNTLTGEFSRANVLRLRWPYVRRVVDSALREQEWSLEQRRRFLADLEPQFKAPFPPVGEETLAGGLANTIAGRICNHFDFKGGGYTVDGACASSLLAVSHACSALVAGDVDVALAGGIDLSLDPFELVGFAKAQALATDEMRVYDTRSSGFWPGEGCGVVVLMRLGDAVARGLPIDVVIRGWGISSDGKGGITRPEAEGQLLALQRAYARAGFGIDTVSYFEGHGTGTAVGDATELRALATALRDAHAIARGAVIGTIKANIGHTKAAAGVAGLIKAARALQEQVVPPTTGCEEPHAELRGEASLRIARDGEPWPADRPLRAGVSAMGFGGINTHVVLEGLAHERRPLLPPAVRTLLDSAQDAELFLFRGMDVGHVRTQIDHLLEFAAKLSRSELADLAAQLARTLGDGPVRAAVVAARPHELAARLHVLRSRLDAVGSSQLDALSGVFLGSGDASPRIGFLFPGQGSPTHADGGALRRRFASARALYDCAALPLEGDDASTARAQPAIVLASLAAWRVLEQLGVEAELAIGHSLGELSALGWAGAFDLESLLRIASARGRAMAERAEGDGVMVSLAAGRADVEAFLNGARAVIAGLNSPLQTVISGTRPAVASLVAHAEERGVRVTPLPVSHAFHSPLMAGAVPALAEALAHEPPRPLRKAILSTVTGSRLAPDADLVDLLCRQVTSPVRFAEALLRARDDVDLWIEVGPGQVLSGIARDSATAPMIATDAGGPSLRGLLGAVGAAFALGAPVATAGLFAGRFTRPFDLDWRPTFFENPCEQAPVLDAPAVEGNGEALRFDEAAATAQDLAPAAAGSALALLRALVAEKTELPLATIRDESHVLHDLHLNSISVGQLVAEAARRLGMAAPLSPTDFARATLADVAQALEELQRSGGTRTRLDERRPPAGVDSWLRTFTVELVERPLPRRNRSTDAPRWRVFAPPQHPWAASLGRALAAAEAGRGVAVCLPPDDQERAISLLLEAARVLREERDLDRFVLVHHGSAGAAFARTLHLELDYLSTCVVDIPSGHPRSLEWTVAEASAAAGYSEAHYDASGTRREPRLRRMESVDQPAAIPLGADDVVLVSGGGKGIGAECAFAMAKQTGARLVLLGRSLPESDAELASNLQRFGVAGVRYLYLPADVTNAGSVRSALRAVEADWGPVTAILHGAGVNVPQRVDTLDETAFAETRAPKVFGARNLLDAVDADRLKLFVTFGSIIARTGMRGEAHYALANEELALLTEDFQRGHPACHCLCLEWSIWSGVGMGDRLGSVDLLAQQGITPIPPGKGVATLLHLLAQRSPRVAVVVSGRIGEVPTLPLERPELPLRRFLERPRVFYPGVELVVDVELSAENDPYLNDHIFRGERLFPAAMGLEAMAQVAMALCEASEPPVFDDLRFDRPVVVPTAASTTIRLAALVRSPNCVEVILRSENTQFQVNHFRATCRFEEAPRALAGSPSHAFRGEAGLPGVPLRPRDLYGTILFQKGRFERLQGYRSLRARQCCAEIASDESSRWFHAYLPAELVLGDPGARDAAIHAVQACIPHATILPVGADRFVPGSDMARGPYLVSARERSTDGDILVYDLTVTGSDGAVREVWEGLRLKVVEKAQPPQDWPEALLGPYCERMLSELVPGAEAAVVLEQLANTDRAARSQRGIERLLDRPEPVVRRYDGKPEVAGDRAVSTAHAGDFTLAVAGPGPIACDLEPTFHRSPGEWKSLLGVDGIALAALLVRERDEDQDVAPTRVWVARECLIKAGAMPNSALVLAASHEGGWCLFTSGSFVVATLCTRLRQAQVPHVLGILVRSENACL